MSKHSLTRRLLLPALITPALAMPLAALADVENITRAFSGIWDQPDQESQGLVLQISADEGDEKTGVAYWFTYGDDLASSWYVGVGPVADGLVDMTLYRADGAGFLEAAGSGSASVEAVGSLAMRFQNCNQGTASFDTPDNVLGSGEFRIKRLTSVMGMRCSGGISDDTPPGTRPTRLEVELVAARDDVTGKGKATFWERADRSDFMVQANGGMADGLYALMVCGDHRGDVEIVDGGGTLAFRSPGIDAKPLLDFDPRDCLIELVDDTGVALTSGDAVLAEKARGNNGGGQGGNNGQGGGNDDADVSFTPTGLVPGAKGNASLASDETSTTFTVHVMKVPAGDYDVVVGGTTEGVLTVEDGPGQLKGTLRFSDPAADDGEPLDFDPSGQLIEIYNADGVILEGLFPDA
ncbi:hypothetical protein F3N42_05230 [Marinihelvus fidelis]|uniref:DUF3471 domain-containing protein n=1 Tax=Marinihelvus fidelis TaxID=2613842 RepID=A0A5N0TC14_9GAMM|nr:hypothetical protein [Marinihelvus fidelis]KAA9132623.1 hypothetical protein F3N42_05230 [Marinihelvus fidelis]